MQCEKPFDHLFVRLGHPVGKDVEDLDAFFRESPGDQDGPVAVERFLFSAHDGYTPTLPPFEKPLDTFPEGLGRCYETEIGLPFTIELPVGRPGSKLLPEENVGDAALSEDRLERSPAELGVPFAVRRRTDVSYCIHVPFLQQ